MMIGMGRFNEYREVAPLWLDGVKERLGCKKGKGESQLILKEEGTTATYKGCSGARQSRRRFTEVDPDDVTVGTCM